MSLHASQVARGTHAKKLSANSSPAGRSPAAAAASSAGSASASTSGASQEDQIFDIEDFTVATPFEKFISALEEQLHAWRVGIVHHAAAADPPTPAAAAAPHSAAPPESAVGTAAPGISLHQAIVTLTGRSFLLSLYHSAPPSSLNSQQQHHARSSSVSAAAASNSSALLALPLRVDHVAAAGLGHHPFTGAFGVSSFLLLQPAATYGEPAQSRTNSAAAAAAHATVLMPSSRRVSKNEASMLLSALSVAANYAQCLLPCFVAVDEGSKQLYWGRACYGASVKFDVRQADDIPTAFQHLTGLTDAFQVQRERVEGRARAQTTGHARTLVAASFGLQQETRKWGYNDVGSAFEHDDDDDPSSSAIRWRDLAEDHPTCFGLAWGPRQDPLVALRLTTAWPFFPEGTFVDNAVYSDLEPMAAPNWRVDVEWRRDTARNPADSEHTPMTNALQRMIDIAQAGGKLTSLASVLGSATADTPSTLARQSSEDGSIASLTQSDGGSSGSGGGGSGNPLSAFRAVQSSLKAHIEDAAKIAAHGESVAADHIDRVMKELLDIEHDPLLTATASSNANYDPFSPTPPVASPADPPVSAQLVPYGSLLSRFVFALLATQELGQLTLRTVATMWTELIAELRFHFETGLAIPKLLSDDAPDFARSILHQKVQLLQRCIRIQKNGRASKGKPAASTSASSSSGTSKTPDWKQPWKSTAWSEERLGSTAAASATSWGDLDDLLDGDAGGGGVAAADASAGSGWGELDLSLGGDVDHAAESDEEDAHADFSRQPEGVASTIPGSFLLLHPSSPLRVPVTQEAKVLTSDKLEEQQEMFARMGTSADSSRLRTEMQTAGLLADMQAFKAANPGCILEDFVRWHSPKDWRAASGKRGELSQRMRKSADGGVNIWQRLWQSAEALPACDQAQLFDAAVEGEQILNYLENVEPSLLFSQLVGIAMQNCLCLMARTRGVIDEVPMVRAAIQKLSHYLKHHNRGNIPQDLHTDFAACELLCAKATTLLLCFPPPTAAASSKAVATGASSTEPSPAPAGREMITNLLSHGSHQVGHGGSDRAQLASLFSCTSKRSKPTSLFHAKPFDYAKPNGEGKQMEAAGAATTTTLPRPDWSEFTFFAPFPLPASSSSSSSSSSLPSSGVSVVGSRTYVSLRHTHASVQPTGWAYPMPKMRVCTAIITQAAPMPA